MPTRSRRAARVQRPISTPTAKKTRSKATTQRVRRRPPAPFLLAAEGPGIGEEHRKTGEALERHWADLSEGALAEIRRLIADSLDGKGDK